MSRTVALHDPLHSAGHYVSQGTQYLEAVADYLHKIRQENKKPVLSLTLGTGKAQNGVEARLYLADVDGLCTLGLVVILKSTFSPSLSVLKPFPWIAEKWTKMSSLPS